MKKFFKSLIKGKDIYLIFIIIGVFTGILFASFIKHDTEYIKFRYNYTSEIIVDENKIISEDNINKVKGITKSWYTGGGISTYGYVEIEDISLKRVDEGYILSVPKKCFIMQNKEGVDAYNDTAARGFLKHLVVAGLDDEVINEYNLNYSYINDKGKEVLGVTKLFDNDFYEAHSLDNAGNLLYVSDHVVKKYMIIFGLVGALIAIVTSIVFSIIFIGMLDKEIKHEYDNETIYRTPFHLSLFKSSAKEFKNVKSLVIISVLLAFVMISKFIPIPSGFAGLGISFGYLFLAISCMLFGPCPALLIGFISDVVGFMIKTDGMFFFGYTIQSMLACFFYALCFYKTHITFKRTLLARVLVNIICNVIVGSLCYAFLYKFNADALLTYIMTVSLPKNLLYLIPQSLVLFFVIKAVSMPMSAVGLIDSEIAENVSFF